MSERVSDSEVEHYTGSLWPKEINAMARELLGLRAREPYVQHLVSCYLFSNCGDEPRRCTCGLDKLKGAAPQ